MHKTDVVIIGAGPVGLFSIFEANMVGLKTHIVDALDIVGGQCAALYPEKPIYDIPAHPRILGAELIENLKKQIEPFNPTFHLGQKVTHVQKHSEGFKIITDKDTHILTKVIFIAAGVGAFGPNRPPLEKLESFEGKSVFYLVKSREDFRDKKIMIAGGGDSAVDWAISLSEIAQHVTLVHRRDKFKAHAESLNRLKQLQQDGKLSIATPYQLSSLNGENGILESVDLADLDGNIETIETDVLLPFYGLAANLGPINEWGLNIDRHTIPVDPSTCSTSIPGIYAIGDIAHYPGKLKLILCGFSEGAIAAYSARHFLKPDEVFHFEYSTTTGVHQK